MTTTITFCAAVRFLCFLLALFLLIVALFAPAWCARIRLQEAIFATALVAWLCFLP